MKISMTMESMKGRLKDRLKESRYLHSLGVAETSVQLAVRFGVDQEKAYLAGLLHDCAREFENDQLLLEAEERGIPVGEVERAMPLLLHSYVGAKYVSECYGVEDAEISQAIARHTVGGSSMTISKSNLCRTNRRDSIVMRRIIALKSGEQSCWHRWLVNRL